MTEFPAKAELAKALSQFGEFLVEHGAVDMIIQMMILMIPIF